jgi:hypothetical protein
MTAANNVVLNLMQRRSAITNGGCLYVVADDIAAAQVLKTGIENVIMIPEHLQSEHTYKMIRSFTDTLNICVSDGDEFTDSEFNLVMSIMDIGFNKVEVIRLSSVLADRSSRGTAVIRITKHLEIMEPANGAFAD